MKEKKMKEKKRKEKKRKEKKRKEKKRIEKEKEKSTEVEEVPEIWTRERLKKNRKQRIITFFFLYIETNNFDFEEGKSTKLLLDSFFGLIVDIMNFNYPNKLSSDYK